MNDTSREEQLVEQYIQDGDLETAVKLLYGLIVKLAAPESRGARAAGAATTTKPSPATKSAKSIATPAM